MSSIKKIISLLFIALMIAATAFAYWAYQPLAQTGSEFASVDFSIKAGSGVRSASRQMRDGGVPIEPFMFEVLARVNGKANKLKAGSFEFEIADTPMILLRKIVNGEFSHASLAIIEGWSFQQMRSAIDAHPEIKHDTASLSGKELIKKINPDFQLPEGLFFPDTYLFAKGSSDLLIYQQAHQSMLKHLDDAWQAKAANLPYKTAYEALIMASIIEKETGRSSERSLIAAVFINRLKAGMLLQTDPTVIYGMGDSYKGKIRKVDLITDTPFNTYTRAGLPPTPIALPGIASLSAALNPEKSVALYFVSRGDGTSQFSDNLTEHNRAVNKYQR
ncbi:endolytic transglycosylase MltG [Undibacterium sp. Ren11W]|uniref:endolytic transglycosylase MltG n=1 Tax=Undibacterium sp. Ren11W TaxID=3413045 RepID=UPI003BF164DB